MPTMPPQDDEFEDFDTWALKLPVQFQLDLPDNAQDIYEGLCAMTDPAQGYNAELDRELALLPIPGEDEYEESL
jgi:hypothetical protein